MRTPDRFGPGGGGVSPGWNQDWSQALDLAPVPLRRMSRPWRDWPAPMRVSRRHIQISLGLLWMLAQRSQPPDRQRDPMPQWRPTEEIQVPSSCGNRAKRLMEGCPPRWSV